jgi:hypothetical protein
MKAAREFKDERVRMAEEFKRLTVPDHENEATECNAEEPVQQERIEEKKEKISGLTVMGVFIACGVWMTLGWGGVTSTLVVVF